ncbi:putative vasohibin-1 [Monocercomonoides exilis]|uniref:putative vasohibin-1 n=1 Tax=Monocercomonoides exilis TaxID=2049356 RepID=UPI00355A3089|nr:putative vasohibin-1 [Monocercomonoides exilis]|eukprot:MONOS_11962.1-p1 / transcript=MONOS_11962.1 / gene=MONOS_11962 / organism=Monocercomonoides_exilis_PA203 / gene_product=vasohibin-1 / transcript_product=vasohibin-1 / location=Mono_scaffold00631:10253-13851(+) / protein_length=1082 / sequence_SO=supercontig / SO=protein_coding / is_pseudo=false
MQKIFETAEKIIAAALPIQCLEATFVSIYLTFSIPDLVIFPVGFTSKSANKLHKHIILALEYNGMFGALGHSRKKSLASKALKFHSFSEMIEDYRNGYQEIGHTVHSLRIGLPILPCFSCDHPIVWKFMKLDDIHSDNEVKSLILSRFTDQMIQIACAVASEKEALTHSIIPYPPPRNLQLYFYLPRRRLINTTNESHKVFHSVQLKTRRCRSRKERRRRSMSVKVRERAFSDNVMITEENEEEEKADKDEDENCGDSEKANDTNQKVQIQFNDINKKPVSSDLCVTQKGSDEICSSSARRDKPMKTSKPQKRVQRPASVCAAQTHQRCSSMLPRIPSRGAGERHPHCSHTKPAAASKTGNDLAKDVDHRANGADASLSRTMPPARAKERLLPVIAPTKNEKLSATVSVPTQLPTQYQRAVSSKQLTNPSGLERTLLSHTANSLHNLSENCKELRSIEGSQPLSIKETAHTTTERSAVDSSSLANDVECIVNIETIPVANTLNSNVLLSSASAVETPRISTRQLRLPEKAEAPEAASNTAIISSSDVLPSATSTPPRLLRSALLMSPHVRSPSRNLLTPDSTSGSLSAGSSAVSSASSSASASPLASPSFDRIQLKTNRSMKRKNLTEPESSVQHPFYSPHVNSQPSKSSFSATFDGTRIDTAITPLLLPPSSASHFPSSMLQSQLYAPRTPPSSSLQTVALLSACSNSLPACTNRKAQQSPYSMYSPLEIKQVSKVFRNNAAQSRCPLANKKLSRRRSNPSGGMSAEEKLAISELPASLLASPYLPSYNHRAREKIMFTPQASAKNDQRQVIDSAKRNKQVTQQSLAKVPVNVPGDKDVCGCISQIEDKTMKSASSLQSDESKPALNTEEKDCLNAVCISKQEQAEEKCSIKISITEDFLSSQTEKPQEPVSVLSPEQKQIQTQAQAQTQTQSQAQVQLQILQSSESQEHGSQNNTAASVNLTETKISETESSCTEETIESDFSTVMDVGVIGQDILSDTTANAMEEKNDKEQTTNDEIPFVSVPKRCNQHRIKKKKAHALLSDNFTDSESEKEPRHVYFSYALPMKEKTKLRWLGKGSGT